MEPKAPIRSMAYGDGEGGACLVEQVVLGRECHVIDVIASQISAKVTHLFEL